MASSDLEARADRLAHASLLAPEAAQIIVANVWRVSPHEEVRETLLAAAGALADHGVDQIDIVLALGAFVHVLISGRNGTASDVAAEVLRRLDRELGFAPEGKRNGR
jgi:hypothetical protein